MITQYHRPSTLDEAVDLLQKPGSVPLGGGTVVNAITHGDTMTVIDLQLLDVADITSEGETVRVGAMTRLEDLVDSSVVPPSSVSLPVAKHPTRSAMPQPSAARSVLPIPGASYSQARSPSTRR